MIKKLFFITNRGKLYRPLEALDTRKDCPLLFLQKYTKHGKNVCYLMGFEEAATVSLKAFNKKISTKQLLAEKYNSFTFTKRTKV